MAASKCRIKVISLAGRAGRGGRAGGGGRQGVITSAGPVRGSRGSYRSVLITALQWVPSEYGIRDVHELQQPARSSAPSKVVLKKKHGTTSAARENKGATS